MTDIRLVYDAFGRPHPVKEADLFQYGLDPDGTVSGTVPAAAGSVIVTTVEVPYADLCTLSSAPYEIVPAPGAGKAILILGVYSKTVISTVDSTQSADNYIAYGNYNDNGLYCNVGKALSAGPGTYWCIERAPFGPSAATSYGVPYNIENLPIVLQNDNDLTGDGEATFTITIAHVII